MRLWSIHPQYLDCIGLVALWREALLAQAVLRGQTRGYRHHPQLKRFQEHPHPTLAIAEYLRVVWKEAARRGYAFDRHKLSPPHRIAKIPVPLGQVKYEFRLLRQKVRHRDARWYKLLRPLDQPAAHPVFRVVAGGVASWERIPASSSRLQKRTYRGPRP